MFDDKESFAKESDSIEQSDTVNMTTIERIRKKEKELKQICSRVDLIEKERELDAKIKKANDIESFLSNNLTATRADYERKINLTTEDIVKTLSFRKLDEDGTKLVGLAMRTVAEENMKSRLYDVELSVYFSPYNRMIVRKGDGYQKIVILFDENHEPVFRWEIKKNT